jgi:vacuolar-type H+-ATPase subunit E/Vma4
MDENVELDLLEKLQEWSETADSRLKTNRIRLVTEALSSRDKVKIKKALQDVHEVIEKTKKVRTRQQTFAVRKRIAESFYRETGRELELSSKRRKLNTEQESLIEQIEQKNASNEFSIPSTQDLKAICEKISKELSSEAVKEYVCCVCDLLNKYKNIQFFMIETFILRDNNLSINFFKRLKNFDSAIPEPLRLTYDCSSFHETFQGLLLSKKGFNEGKIQICKTCTNSLLKHSANDIPPKFSIANGFAIGELPESLWNATWIEHMMCAPTHVLASTVTLKAKAHRAITSHAICFDCTPVPFASMLPRDVNENGYIHVILAGPLTKEQELYSRTMNEVRPQKLKELMNFYKSHETSNYVYKDIRISETTDEEFKNLNANLISVLPTVSVSGIAEEMDSVANTSDLDTNSTTHTIVHNDSIFTSKNSLSEQNETEFAAKKYDVFVA